jgi:hypothetical protein
MCVNNVHGNLFLFMLAAMKFSAFLCCFMVFRYMTAALTKDGPCVPGVHIHIKCFFIRIYSTLLRASTSWIEHSYPAGQMEINAVT